MPTISCTRVALTAALGLGLLPAAGCVSWTADFTRTIDLAAPHVEGGAIDVRTRNGSVRVESSEGAEVRVVAVIRSTSRQRADATTATLERDPATGRLVLTARPPEGSSWRSGEGVSMRIIVPGEAAFDVETTNGEVDLARSAGPTRISTSNAQVALQNHRGEADIRLTNGPVRLSGPAGPVSVETSNGRVEVRLDAGAVGPINVQTSNGSVLLVVPSGFAGSFACTTSNASISARGATSINAPSRSSSEVVFGSGGPASTVRTSNAAIELEAR